jgi:formylglycine-generating enzyme required for sulfatase activity
MVMIPAATFQMGSNELGSMPVHAVRLSAYCIDRTEVTVAAYRACAGCAPAGTDTSCNGSISGREQHPINCVRFFDAEAYCRAVGKRLPSEAEWEYAARGPEGRLYPWGREAPMAQPCWHQLSTCAVGTHSASDSWFSVHDLAGNVAEWTGDWFRPYSASDTVVDDPTGPESASERAIRGGGWAQNLLPAALEAVHRSSAPPDTSSPQVGFRCARR